MMQRVRENRLAIGDNLDKNKAVAPRKVCVALSQKGTVCHQIPSRIEHVLCVAHHKEYKKLCEQYKQAQARYDRLAVSENDSDLEKKWEKVKCGKETVNLRNQVNHRFFSLHANNRSHIQWILKMEHDIRTLESTLSSGDEESQSLPALEADQVIQVNAVAPVSSKLVYRSLLDPEVPMSALSHLFRDSPAVVVKQFAASMTEEQISQLYDIAPSLNDSTSAIRWSRLKADVSGPDAGDHVIRFIFREYLLWKGDADLLYRAHKTDSIDTFLRKSFPSELSDYIKFFKSFGRVDTLHFLRDAICDYLLRPDLSTTKILGAAVATDDVQRSMPIEGWDILYAFFSDIVEWCNIEQFCVRTADLCLVKKLIALGRYGEATDDEPGWLDRDNDISQECSPAILQGFIAVTKGFSDPPLPLHTISNGMQTTKNSRCYLVGRMAKGDTRVAAFIEEIVKRVARYIVFVYDFDQNRHELKETVVRNDDAEDPWITRTRSVPVYEESQDTPWQTEWSLRDVRQDLAQIKALRDRNMSCDYYEFIIIDRAPGSEFMILDNVADALCELSGYHGWKEIIEKAIDDTLPADELQQWRERVTLDEDFSAKCNISDIHYEGNRVRSWDVVDSDPDCLRRFGQKPRSRSDVRTTRKIVAEMECCGLITPLTTFQPTQTCPIVLQGDDGLDDIYFGYDLGPLDESALRHSPLGAPESFASGNTLFTFAQNFKSRHPDAVFAKGRIHVHYCAWPMPAMKHGTRGRPTFRTIEGHLYQWNVLPFDSPLSPRLWQNYVHNEMNRKLPFVSFAHTTFVVCAKDRKSADKNLNELHSAAAAHNWRLSVPPPSLWSTDIQILNLKKLWGGVQLAMCEGR